MERFANTPATSLFAAAIAGATTLTVTAAGAFPTLGDFRIRVDSELMLVTAVSGTTFTVTRGIENTTALAHRRGSLVRHIVTAGSLVQLKQDAVDQAVTTGLAHEEFVPATGGVNVSLAHVASVVLMVSRNGLVQSADAGHYTVSGSTIAFSSAFSASERVVVAYSRGQDAPIGAQVWVLPPGRRARLRDYSFSHTHQNTA